MGGLKMMEDALRENDLRESILSEVWDDISDFGTIQEINNYLNNKISKTKKRMKEIEEDIKQFHEGEI